ncbi:MAG: ATP diphosphatase [Paraglaciecola sp.]
MGNYEPERITPPARSSSIWSTNILSTKNSDSQPPLETDAPSVAPALPKLAKLLEIMAQLRDPDSGCPWDKQQNFKSLVPHTIEEAYEVADAIEQGNMHDIKDELGDLLFQVVFYAQLGKEQGEFDFEAIAQTISDKLVRRHPHVFTNSKSKTDDELNVQWEQIKAQERTAKGAVDDPSVLANIPVGMPPLVRAQKLQKKCATVGFDWPDVAPVLAKVHEEIQEVMDEVQASEPDQQAIEEEIGDLLFTVVNLSRHLHVDAQTALRKANCKFEKRFRKVEGVFAQRTGELGDARLDEMEKVWQQIKHT